MKKTLEHSLLALLAGCFMEANALQQEIKTAPLPHHALVLPEVADIVRNADLVILTWCEYRELESVAPENLQLLKNVVHDMQTFSEEQLLEFINGFKLEASKKEDTPDVRLLRKMIFSHNQIEKEMRLLADLAPSISLLSKLSEAYETLSTKDASDKDARDILYTFAKTVKGKCFDDVYYGLSSLLPLIYSGKNKLRPLIAVVCGLCCSGNKPDELLWNYGPDKKGSVSINIVPDWLARKYGISNSLFEPCKVHFEGEINWDIGSSDMGAIIRILSNEGAIQFVSMISTNDNFIIPFTPNDRIKHISLSDLIISDRIIEFLHGAKTAKILEISWIREGLDKLIEFLESSKCNVDRIDYSTKDEGAKLLHYLLSSKYKNSLKTLSLSPHFLITNKHAFEKKKIEVHETGIKNLLLDLRLTKKEDLLATLQVWNALVASSTIVQKHLIVSTDELDQVQNLKQFRILLSQSNINKLTYTHRDTESIDLLMKIIPFFPPSLEEVELPSVTKPSQNNSFQFSPNKILKQPQDAPNEKSNIATDNILECFDNVEADEFRISTSNILGYEYDITSKEFKDITDKILRYCHNIEHITCSDNQYPELDACSVALSPFIETDCEDDNIFVAHSLNKGRKCKLLLNWEEPPSAFAKYLAMMEELIINTRYFRAECATFATALLKIKHGYVDLKPLNDQLAEYVAFLADVQLWQLTKTINKIVYCSYLESRKKLIKAYGNFVDEMKYFESKFNTLTRDIFTLIRGFLKEESNIFLIEQLHAIEENVMTQKRWCVHWTQQAYFSQTLEQAKRSEAVLQKAIDEAALLQEPAKKKKKE